MEPQLPGAAELEVWFGEPVKALAVAVTAFTSNRKGFPVLPRAHQDFLSRFLQMGVQVAPPLSSPLLSSPLLSSPLLSSPLLSSPLLSSPLLSSPLLSSPLLSSPLRAPPRGGLTQGARCLSGGAQSASLHCVGWQ